MTPVLGESNHPLYGVAASRQIELLANANLPAHTLMQRAGLAAARLTLALAPHAQKIWIACGPGNNGGDGLEAAMHLHQWGKTVIVTHTRQATLPSDAQASLERALAAGVRIAAQAPTDFDFCIDALLGLGSKPTAPLPELMASQLHLMRTSGAPLLALDLPTGLDADTGCASNPPENTPKLIATSAYTERSSERFTLSFLTLKPGLFTTNGPDLSGQIWFDALGTTVPTTTAPTAVLLGNSCTAPSPRTTAAHASHKGNFGDVAVIGGQTDSTQGSLCGAALLAARAALHTGAGRVFVSLLGTPALHVDPVQPELMFRPWTALDLRQHTVVCGCGGGSDIAAVLPQVLSTVHQLVLDADALNTIAQDTQLQAQLKARQARGYSTVLTPHPLEAARLLQTDTAHVQAQRLGSAQELAERFLSVVVLKGCGSIVAAPGQLPGINTSGNARLATAGTGDVLAGMIGAQMAQGQSAYSAACQAVFTHGQLADHWPQQCTLTASKLARCQAKT